MGTSALTSVYLGMEKSCPPKTPEISSAEKMARLDRKIQIMKSGYAAITQQGEIVDRRERPDATPYQSPSAE